VPVGDQTSVFLDDVTRFFDILVGDRRARIGQPNRV
jgi:hypothetical protein